MCSQFGDRANFAVHSVVWDDLIPDRERYFADMAAKQLDVPIHFTSADRYGIYEGWEQLRRPEPLHNLQPALGLTHLRGLASSGRVVLTGIDGDALLSESVRPYFAALMRSGKYGVAINDLVTYFLCQPSGSLWRSLRGRLLDMFSRTGDSLGALHSGFPDWLEPDFERTYRLRERWAYYMHAPSVAHSSRPYAHSVYGLSFVCHCLLFRG
jgi:asparagine synthase (glutamine-hydrolysing)